MKSTFLKLCSIGVSLLIASSSALYAQAQPLTSSLATAPSAAPASAPGQDLAGVWEGAISIGAVKLRIVFNVARDDDGLNATLDSPDQGAKGIPVVEVSLDGDQVSFTSPSIGGAFRGARDADFNKIDGQWSQGGTKLPLVLQRVEKATEIRRPQHPTKPFPYREEEVSYENTAGVARLGGALTLPRGDGPFPAVLLITGSGSQDRDESIFGHKPFLVIADYLTRRGIAVLRVDDRGVGASSGDVMKATSADFAGDVLAGVGYLRSRADIARGHVGLIGHSEGALIAPMVAAQSEDVAYIVLLAGPGVPGDEILYEQGKLIAAAAGSSAESQETNRKLQAALFEILRSEPDENKAEEAARKLISEAYDRMSDEEKKAVGEREQFVSNQSRTVMVPWFRYFVTYDPRPTLRRVRCPVLALTGEKDLQVSPSQNLPEIEKALRAAENRDFLVKELPGLNHLFQTATSGGINEYGKIEETFSPAALEMIAEWIEKRVPRGTAGT